ncbi:MAG: hypothetical protein ACFFFG_04485 [Candidatus Thorarchaeota archaeon]
MNRNQPFIQIPLPFDFLGKRQQRINPMKLIKVESQNMEANKVKAVVYSEYGIPEVLSLT